VAPSSDTKVVGSAGEHFVCSTLAQLRWSAALTREGVAHADVLAVHPDPPRRMVEVQVKTIRANPRPKWPMGGRWTSASESCREWYVFVLLGADVTERPRCFIVPRDHATAGAWIAHENWRTQPGIAPGKRNTPVERVRVGIDVWESYAERWDLLQRSAYEAPVLLPPEVLDLMNEPRIGFPDWHPWSSTVRGRA